MTDELIIHWLIDWFVISLFRVSDASGQLRVTEIANGNLRHEQLDSNDAFIVDQGGTAIYVWVGKGATKEEKLQGMKVAVNFLRSKKYPDYTQVTMVKEGMELPLFKQCFVNWPVPKTLNGPMMKQKTYHAGRGIGEECNAFLAYMLLFSAFLLGLYYIILLVHSLTFSAKRSFLSELVKVDSFSNQKKPLFLELVKVTIVQTYRGVLFFFSSLYVKVVAF